MDFDLFSQESNNCFFDDDDETNDEYFDAHFNESPWDYDHEESLSNNNPYDQSITDSNQENNSLPPPKSKSKSKQKKSTPTPRKKPTNLKPFMDSNQINFMDNLYQHFTGKKTEHIRKEILCKYYHPLIVQKLASKYNYKIRLTNREEQRGIQLYFMHFAPHESYIMKAIKDLEQENLINYQRDLIQFKKIKS